MSAVHRSRKMSDSIRKFNRISKHIYLFKDVCNVYVIKKGNYGILVNTGSGNVIDYLTRIGVEKIDWILHTHHFRDLAKGDSIFAKDGTKIAAPISEVQLFREADKFWSNLKIFSRYSFAPTTFTLRQNIPIDLELDNSTDFMWKGLSFEIVHTPGSTLGSLSIILDIDDAKVAFTGDLIHSPGKVWKLHNLQRRYNDACKGGVSDTLESLHLLESKNIDLILPSHGEPIKEIHSAVCKLGKNLESVVNILEFKDKIENNQWQLLPHLYYQNTSYFIISKTGKVMVYDYIGGQPNQLRRASRKDLNRIIDETNNFKKFDVVLASHYHDDHVAGFNKLRNEYGTKIWIYENMVDILEHPDRYSIPCLFNENIKVDRILKDKEVIQWEEYEFTIYHFPGQSQYHMAMFGLIDNVKVLFVGDSTISPRTIFRAAGINGLNCCRIGENEGVMKCAKLMLKLKPDFVLPSHRGMVKVTEARLKEYYSWARKYVEIMEESSAEKNANMSWDPNWVYLYPYYQQVRPGDRVTVSANIVNYLESKTEVTVELELPDQWVCLPAKQMKEIASKSLGVCKFRVDIPHFSKGSTNVIGANIIFDGEDYGEVAEALVQLNV